VEVLDGFAIGFVVRMESIRLGRYKDVGVVVGLPVHSDEHAKSSRTSHFSFRWPTSTRRQGSPSAHREVSATAGNVIYVNAAADWRQRQLGRECPDRVKDGATHSALFVATVH